MATDCIFCKIVNKEIPSSIVYENDKVLAFNDINPVAPVHVLLVPKVHIENAGEIDESNVDVVSAIQLAANHVAKEKGLTSYRLLTNNGKEAGQTVFHLHYHLIGGKEIHNLI